MARPKYEALDDKRGVVNWPDGGLSVLDKEGAWHVRLENGEYVLVTPGEEYWRACEGIKRRKSKKVRG